MDDEWNVMQRGKNALCLTVWLQVFRDPEQLPEQYFGMKGEKAAKR